MSKTCWLTPGGRKLSLSETIVVHDRCLDFLNFAEEYQFRDTPDELRWTIEDAFDAFYLLNEAQQVVCDNAPDIGVADDIFETRRKYREDHPEWYLLSWEEKKAVLYAETI